MSPEVEAIIRILDPDALDARDKVRNSNGKFVHYTSADTAMKIIRCRCVWMRNAMTMNDYSEISHGKECLFPAYKNPEVGGKLRGFLNEICPGFSGRLENLFNGWLETFEQETYITALSQHLSPSEDSLGRLSMWRAYCPRNGVALVLNNTPFMAETDKLKAFSYPVSYENPQSFELRFSRMVERVLAKRELLASLPEEQLVGYVFSMLKVALLCTKHPGFKEECEWRIIYSPKEGISKKIEKDFATIEGVPQRIFKLPLVNDPDNGLHCADIPSLLHMVIIGPTLQPLTMMKGFMELLGESGIENPRSRVSVSQIPLRAS